VTARLQDVGGLVGCTRCEERCQHSGVVYEPPYAFELVDRVDESGDDYELRGQPGAFQCRAHMPLRSEANKPGWRPLPGKRWAICTRCWAEEPDEALCMVFDLSTGELIPEQSYEGWGRATRARPKT
jgi:hypothetical protein